MQPSGSRAQRALPTTDDLWGSGWRIDDEDDDDLAGGSAVQRHDECLPDAFPHARLRDDAEITYERDDPAALVHAVALCFDDRSAADVAWGQLAGAEFAACFARGVAGDVELDDRTELLGPAVSRTEPVPVAPGVRVVGHRAAFAATDADLVHPVALDLAVAAAGDLVVALWCASAGDERSRRGWDALVGAAQHRLAAESMGGEATPGG